MRDMTAILNAKWHGVAALGWWLCGVCMMLAFGPNPWPEGLVICMLLGWIAPVLLLAFSGLRGESVASRVCAILVLLTFVWLALRIFIPPLPSDGH
jgi:hypothetical protein